MRRSLGFITILGNVLISILKGWLEYLTILVTCHNINE